MSVVEFVAVQLVEMLGMTLVFDAEIDIEIPLQNTLDLRIVSAETKHLHIVEIDMSRRHIDLVIGADQPIIDYQISGRHDLGLDIFDPVLGARTVKLADVAKTGRCFVQSVAVSRGARP